MEDVNNVPHLNPNILLRDIAKEFFNYVRRYHTEEQLVAIEPISTFDDYLKRWCVSAGVHRRVSIDSIRNILSSNKLLVVYKKKYVILLTREERKQERVSFISSINTPDSGNKGGIEIEWNYSTDVICSPNQMLLSRLTIKNCKRRTRTITSNEIRYDHRLLFQLRDAAGNLFRAPITINGLSSIDLILECTPVLPGIVESLLLFTVDRGSFIVHKRLAVRCGDPTLIEYLKPTAPFTRMRRIQRNNIDRTSRKIVNGNKPVFTNSGNYKSPQPFLISPAWREMCKDHIAEDHLIDNWNNLSINNYSIHYHNLLWTEEIQMDFDIVSYSMNEVSLEPAGHFLRLYVPGLAEKRPSVMRGDSVLSKETEDDTTYRGYAHNVGRDFVDLSFTKKLHGESYARGRLFDIQFSFSRKLLKIFHQGIAACGNFLQNQQSKIFPSEECQLQDSITLPNNIRWFNRSLNAEQQLAVLNIVEGRGRAAPYIIFGPPGTGKTSTLIEAIQQVSKYRSEIRILACAPSNAAADNILLRLAGKGVNKSEMFRYMAFQRDRKEIDNVVMEFSYFSDALEGFDFPPMEKFIKYKIVVCTCAMAGQLINYSVPKGHFQAVFVDESGHAWEPEVVSSFVHNLSGADSQLILAGDPEQLGPVVRSSIAMEGGLGCSFLERLTKSVVLYQKDESVGVYNPLFMTKLLKCYRCHPDILAIPNRLFYEDELIACADLLVSHNFIGWAGLPNPDFPLILHGIIGTEYQEANSPSWFNPDEIGVVISYVQRILNERKARPDEIGIITPYQKHAAKIRTALARDANLGNIDVGSTEQFQGREKRVIIISTVRSTADKTDFDEKHQLGFLKNPKRFNVSVTRAKALLIVVGNPFSLGKDDCWGSLFSFIHSRGGYIGCEWNPETFVFEMSQQRDELNELANQTIDGHDTDDDQDDRGADSGDINNDFVVINCEDNDNLIWHQEI
eukprot:gene6640-9114_t